MHLALKITVGSFLYHSDNPISAGILLCYFWYHSAVVEHLRVIAAGVVFVHFDVKIHLANVIAPRLHILLHIIWLNLINIEAHRTSPVAATCPWGRKFAISIFWVDSHGCRKFAIPQVAFCHCLLLEGNRDVFDPRALGLDSLHDYVEQDA